MKSLTRLTPLAFALLAATSARADNVADFYKGKTITVHVGFAAGGGFDLLSRVLSRHMPKHIPGNPTMVVSNMPGAGSMVAASYIYNVAPKDGTVLGVTASTIMLEPLYGNDKAKYEAEKFEWLGSMHSETHACAVWRGGGADIKTLDDLLKSKKTIVFGSPGPETENTRLPMFMRHFLNAPVKVVHGYPGTRPIVLAAQKGELDATCGMTESSVTSTFRNEFASGDLKMIFHVNLDQDRIPLFGDAAGVRAMLKTDEQKMLGEIMFRTAAITRPIMAPPGTPKERVSALQRALMETMKDPDMIEEGKKMQIEFLPMSGDRVAAIMASFANTPKELFVKAAALTKHE